jgi:hypothetical protein
VVVSGMTNVQRKRNITRQRQLCLEEELVASNFLPFSISDKGRAIRWLVVGLSPRRAGFDPTSVHLGFVVFILDNESSFSQTVSAFPCQNHSINVLY